MAAVAARNNAEWCELVARSHGLTGRFDDDAWTCPQRTPPTYPDAVTLLGDVEVPALLARLDLASPGASVKDSFASIDLSVDGFGVLFEAEWIARPAEPTDRRQAEPPVGGGLTWDRVTEPGELAAWEAAPRTDGGHGRLFRDELLDDESVAVLAAHRDGQLGAGAILNRAAGVVGVSNVFARSTTIDATWAAVIALSLQLYPGVPMVGYETGDDLAPCHRQGFRSVGPLRVWLRDVAPSP